MKKYGVICVDHGVRGGGTPNANQGGWGVVGVEVVKRLTYPLNNSITIVSTESAVD